MLSKNRCCQKIDAVMLNSIIPTHDLAFMSQYVAKKQYQLVLVYFKILFIRFYNVKKTKNKQHRRRFKKMNIGD